MSAFPYYKQPDQMDCGPTCLRMVAKHYGRNFNVQTLGKTFTKTRRFAQISP